MNGSGQSRTGCLWRPVRGCPVHPQSMTENAGMLANLPTKKQRRKDDASFSLQTRVPKREEVDGILDDAILKPCVERSVFLHAFAQSCLPLSSLPRIKILTRPCMCPGEEDVKESTRPKTSAQRVQSAFPILSPRVCRWISPHIPCREYRHSDRWMARQMHRQAGRHKMYEKQTHVWKNWHTHTCTLAQRHTPVEASNVRHSQRGSLSR